MAGLHRGRWSEDPQGWGSGCRRGITTCHQAPKQNGTQGTGPGTGTQACVARGQEPPGTLQEASDREEVGHCVHRYSLWLRTRLLCRQGPLIMRTDVALRLFTGPLSPEPSLTRTEILLSLPDTRVPEQHTWHLRVPPALPSPSQYKAWWASLVGLSLPPASSFPPSLPSV